MYDGSLCGYWEAIVTFQQMIVLCDADGVVDMTPQALVARTSIPLEHIKRGIELLGQPDKHSRSSLEGGRRIIPIDPNRPWGWEIVNYEYYKTLANKEDKKEKDRLRLAEKRSQPTDSKECRKVSQSVADVAYVNVNVLVGIDEKAWNEWMEYRKAIGKPIKPASVQAAMRRMLKHGEGQAAAVEHSIANGYQGLYGAKDEGNKRNGEKRLSAVDEVRAATGGRRF